MKDINIWSPGPATTFFAGGGSALTMNRREAFGDVSSESRLVGAVMNAPRHGTLIDPSDKARGPKPQKEKKQMTYYAVMVILIGFGFIRLIVRAVSQ